MDNMQLGRAPSCIILDNYATIQPDEDETQRTEPDNQPADNAEFMARKWSTVTVVSCDD